MEINFLFHDSLNDFLPATKKNRWIIYVFHLASSVKDAIEALGVPHTEVDIILVQGAPAHFNYQLKNGDRIEVFPLRNDDIYPVTYSLSRQCLHHNRFVLDVHLGKLCKALRILGIDALLENNFSDKMIAQISFKESRIVLTRDIGLLKQKVITCGYWLRSQQWEEQLDEVFYRYQLVDHLKPFTRCIVCNGMLQMISKNAVLHELPQLSKNTFEDYFQCQNCKRVYWKGSHYDRMEKWVRKWTSKL